MFVSRAVPAATMSRATAVRATPVRRGVSCGSSNHHFAPKANPALPKRGVQRARVSVRVSDSTSRVVAIDAIPRVCVTARRAVSRRRVVTQATAVGVESNESESNGPSAFTVVVVAAALVGAALAFAYGDIEPLLGAVTAEKLAPVQDATRAAFVGVKTSTAIAGDAAVELALDAYDAAILLAVKAQDALANLWSNIGGMIADISAKAGAGSGVNPLLNPDTPLGSFLASIVAGAAYFADAAANGQWAKILCYKPFKTVAAVTLTVLRIVVSWFLSGAEFACSMLYATPAYAAAIAIVALVLVRKVVRTVSKNKTSEVSVATATSAGATMQSTQSRIDAISAVTKSVTNTSEQSEAVSESSSEVSEVAMPATAVFEASTRVMTEEEKAVMMRRVNEAKNTIRQTSSFATSETTSSYNSRSLESASYDSSSNSSYGSAYTVEQSDVDRIYNELTSKYGTADGSASGSSYDSYSSSYASSYGSFDVPLPSALPTTTTKSSTFDADAFLAAFATDSSSSQSYTAQASALSSTYATTTTDASSAPSSTQTSAKQASVMAAKTEVKAAKAEVKEVKAVPPPTPAPTPVSTTSTTTSSTSLQSTSASASKFSGVSRDKLNFSKVNFNKVGGLFGSVVKKTVETATPVAKDAWRETVELTKVVVPSVPKLVEGSVSGIGKITSSSSSKQAAVVAMSESDGVVTTSAAAASETTETTTTTTTETVVTVEEIAEASASFTSESSNVETGTVWKKKKKN